MAWRDRVLANNPIIYYEFEESSGAMVAVDSGPNSIDANIATDTVLEEPGEHGFAFRFEGETASGVQTGDDNTLGSPFTWTYDVSALSAFTFEQWVKQSDRIPYGDGGGADGKNDQWIWVAGSSGLIIPELVLTGNAYPYGDGDHTAIVWNFGDGNGLHWVTNNEPSDGDWHLLQVDADGTNAHIYWDDTIVAIGSFAGPYNLNDFAARWTLGDRRHPESADNTRLWGWLDDVALYPVAVADLVDEPECDDVLINTPILYYHFEESGPTVVVDSSGNGNDAISDDTDGLTTYEETGQAGFAYRFHQVGGVGGSIGPVVVDNTGDTWPPGLDTMSEIGVDCYVKQFGTAGNQRIFEIGTSGITGEVALLITSTDVYWGLNNDVGYKFMTWAHGGSPTDGDFHHLQADFDGALQEMHIYWDDALVATLSSAGTTTDFADAAGKFTIGWKGHGGAPGDSDTFDGIIDEFILYPFAIANLTTCEPTPPTPTLPIAGPRDDVYYEELGYVQDEESGSS